MAIAAADLPSAKELTSRISSSLVGAFDLFAIYLGDRLGYYRSLAADGPATSTQLAARTSTAERYAREWLEQQAVTGFLTVDDPMRPAPERVFALPVAYRPVLADPVGAMALTPMMRVFVGALKPFASLVEAFRTGRGIPYADYGADFARALADSHRPMLLEHLTQEYLPAMPDIHARLASAEPSRVADIGMGFGWSSIALAKGYSNVRVDGFDLDEVSVQAARELARAEGVSDRVTFHVRDAGDPQLADRYDFAMAFGCIHDMADPVAAIAAMRRLVGPGGTALVVDEKPAEVFGPLGNELERACYGFSILHCLPVGMVD